MPQYKNAAEVRAAHPGVYDDMTDADINAKLAARTPAPAEAPGNPEMRHATAGDSPSSAFLGELGRTGVEAGKGLLRSPWDAVKGLFNLPGTITKGLTEDLPKLISDPSLLTEAPSAIAAGAKDLGDHPQEAGSLLGQMLLAPRIPGALKAGAIETPGVVGRGIGAVGRASEAAGKSTVLTKAQKLAPLELLTGHPVAAAVSAVGPELLKGGGRLAQRGGAALEGLTDAMRPAPPAPTPAIPLPSVKQIGGMRFSSEAPYYGYQLDDLGTPKTDVPHTSPHGAIDGEVLQGLRDSVSKATKTPIEQFYENDPQARIGGAGRMTGQFEEGAGGLRDISQGNFTRNPSVPRSPLDALAHLSEKSVEPALAGMTESPDALDYDASTGPGLSPLDELARLSGRAATSARAQALLDKLGVQVQ